MGRRPNPERRGQILDAARELFGQNGYHNTQIADIAEALGIGHGTVYRYFQNKRDIFEHVVDEVVAHYAAALQTESPTAATTLEEYEAQLRRIGETLIALFAEHPAGLLVAVQAETIDDEMRDRLDRAMTLFRAMSEQRMRNGVDRGFLRPDLDVEVTAQLLLASTFEAIRQAVRSDDPVATGRRYFDVLLFTSIRGIAAS